METRKVQVTGGGSSYIITLPKEWIRSHEIEKNDPIGIIKQPDGTLLITTKRIEEQSNNIKEFNIRETEDPAYLFRRLIGAYIMGFSIIKINSDKRINPKLRECILQFTQATIGPEIMDETVTSVTIKDLINPIEMAFDKILNRMYILVKTMHEDAILALIKKDKKLPEEVIKRDFDVDRLHWLIARQANTVMKNTILARKMKVTPEQANCYFVISRIIERIGDHAVKIAENLPIIIKKELEDIIVKQIKEASSLAINIFSNSIDAWTEGDINKANETIETMKILVSSCEKIHNSAILLEGAPPIAVSYIIESIRRTGEYAVDISEVTINLFMSV